MEQSKTVYLVASGDARLEANRLGWEEQEKMEGLLARALARFEYQVLRAHPYDPKKEHGFIDSQKMGMQVFASIPPDAPVVVAESVWQYTHHVLAGLTTHQGPILTVANWSGTWPGLVGMLNLNGSLTKAEVNYSTLWSEDFNDPFFMESLQQWLETAQIQHDFSHVHHFNEVKISSEEQTIGVQFADQFRKQKAIMGVFDEGCMGMFNAIVPDHLLHQTGVFKERLSQATLFAEMQQVSSEEAASVLAWLQEKGMQFDWDESDAMGLRKAHTLEQCKMYIAAVRLAGAFHCDTIGIQYQLGLKDLTVASDLAEGLLNNTDRPPVHNQQGNLLYAGRALPHFNEVDECAGLDGLITYRLWERLGMDGANTLHDLRWGEYVEQGQVSDFVWVFLISGAAPPNHFIDGYQGAVSERQPYMYFKMGGGSLKGISKPGWIVWSRIYISDQALHCDLGVGQVVELSREETERRWQLTSPPWPIMHATLKGVTRDQMMAKHQANHIQVVYATDEESAYRSCRIKGVAMAQLGIQVHFCGDFT